MNYYNIIPDFWQILPENFLQPWSLICAHPVQGLPYGRWDALQAPPPHPESDKQKSMDHTSKII